MYRQLTASCPGCAGSLIEDVPGRLTCGGCGGLLIAASVLGELLRVAAPEAEFPHGVIAFPREHDAARIRCPVCRTQMKPGVLFGVPVDQCYVDGLWIVRGGLAVILETVSERAKERAG